MGHGAPQPASGLLQGRAPDFIPLDWRRRLGTAPTAAQPHPLPSALTLGGSHHGNPKVQGGWGEGAAPPAPLLFSSCSLSSLSFPPLPLAASAWPLPLPSPGSCLLRVSLLPLSVLAPVLSLCLPFWPLRFVPPFSPLWLRPPHVAPVEPEPESPPASSFLCCHTQELQAPTWAACRTQPLRVLQPHCRGAGGREAASLTAVWGPSTFPGVAG